MKVDDLYRDRPQCAPIVAEPGSAGRAPEFRCKLRRESVMKTR
jgi:hypothetical protein